MNNKTTRPNKKNEFTPLKITIIYLIFGGAWILFSDTLLNKLSQSPELALKFQTYKGWLFIILTAFIVYHFVKKAVNQLNASRKELKQSKERWQFALEGNRDGVWDWDLQTNKVHFSERWKEILGYSKEEIEGSFKQWEKLVHRDDLDFVKSEIQKNLDGITPYYETEFRMLAKDGSYRWILDRGKVTSRDENGEPLRMVGTHTDIEDKKSAHESIRISEDKFSKVFHSSQDAIAITTMDTGTYLDVNDGFVKLSGFSKDELIGSKSLDINIWENPKDREYLVDKIKSDGEITNFEAPFKTKNGPVITGLMSAKTITIENKKCLLTITRNITERREMIRQLKESKERYSDLVEHLSSGVIVFSTNNDGKDFIIRNLNKAAEIIDFIKRQNYIGKNLSELFSSKEKSSFIDIVKMVWETGNPKNFPLISYKDTKIDEWREYYVYKLSSGEVVAIYDDLTEKMRVQQDLKESELRYKELSESIDDIFFALDKEFNFTFWNKASQNLTKLPEEETLGKNIFDLFPDFKDTDLKSTFEKVIQNKNSVARTIPYIINNIEYIFEITIYPSINGLSVFAKDVTEFKKAQAELKKLSRAVEQSPVSIMITDSKGCIEYMNPKSCEMSGYTMEEVKGKNTSIFSTHEQTNKYYDKLWKTILSGNDWKGEFHNKKKNGETYWESVSISPLKNSRNELTHFIAIKEDITERKITEESLKLAKERAEEMNNLKTSFLANMSHELRTPLVGILGFSEMLRDELTDEDYKNMADTICRSGNRLLDTLNSILDLTKIESNKIDISFEKIPIVPGVKRVVDSFYAAAKQKNLELKTEIKSPNAAALLNDKMFEQILNNLINNAIKFTDEGEVKVEVNTCSENNKDFAFISVSDTGIGIPDKSKHLIFDEFRQVSEGLSRNYEGTGLGLTITKKFVTLMKGEISVKSIVDKGSTFTVKFPSVKMESGLYKKN